MDEFDPIYSLNPDEIFNLTGCLQPCRFLRYNILSDITDDSVKDENERNNINKVAGNGNHTFLQLKIASRKITVKTETLIFPLRSFISEFGGSLGLFLGFSFIMLWDAFEQFIILVMKSCKEK